MNLMNYAAPFRIHLFNPQRDKISRAESVEHILRAGFVWAPDREWSQQVIDQCGIFPFGAHDDFVDCVTMGLRSLRDNGFLDRQEERLNSQPSGYARFLNGTVRMTSGPAAS